MNWTKATNYITMGLVFLLAIGAFVLSYVALWDIAIKHGLPKTLAWIWPLLIDGSIVVFSIAVIRAALHGEGERWPWSLIIVFTVATIAFNALHSNQIPVATKYVSIVVFIVPPIALVLAFETAMAMIRTTATRSGINQSITEIEAESHKKRAEAANEISQLQAAIEARQNELANLEGQLEQATGQLREEAQTLEQAIETYNQDIEAKRQELKQLEAGQLKAYLPANLTIEQRQEIVQRMEADGLTVEQTAGLVGVSPGTVKNDRKANRVAVNGNGLFSVWQRSPDHSIYRFL